MRPFLQFLALFVFVAAGSPALAAVAAVLPPVALGKKADWKAASKVEKALEAALGAEADVLGVSAAGAKDKKLGKKTLACKGEAPCFAKLAAPLGADHVLASLVIGRGKRQKVVMVLVSAAGAEVEKWSGKVADVGAQAARMIGSVRKVAPVAAAAPAAAAVEAEGRDSVAIMGFSVTELPDSIAARLTDGAVLGVHKLKLFDVISGDDIKAMLDQQQLKDILNCDSNSCLAELGGAIDVHYMINGKAAKAGDMIRVTVTLLDVYNAKAIAREVREIKAADIEKELPGLAKKLFNPILATQGGSVMLRCTEVGASLYIDGDLVTTATGRVFKTQIGGGTHRIEAKKKGFVTWAKDIDVAAKSEQMIVIDMLPSQDYIRKKVARAKSGRMMGFVGGGFAVALAGSAVALQMMAQDEFDSGAEVMKTGCNGSCLDGDVANDSWALSTLQGSLKLNPAAEGLEDAKAKYTQHFDRQGNYLNMAMASVGLAGVSVIYGAWSYLSADNPAKWEQFLIDEAPMKKAGAPAAK